MPLSTPYIRLGLIGYPVSHSLSPKIQNAALSACGLEGEYSLFPVHPDDQERLKALLDRVRSGEMTGLNVTIPHKQNVIPLLDELTPAARSIGAVNIVYLREGKLIGNNTDAAGFLADLKKFLGTDPLNLENQRSAIVLGAGGSARSVVYALHNDGWKVTIAARRFEQAQQLARSIFGHSLPITNLTDIPFSTFHLLVNTIPLGMTPNVDVSPLPEGVNLPKEMTIYDLVYNPRETKLVRDARAQGLRAVTGLGMLIEQAAIGFELWMGRRPPIETFRNAVE